MKNQTAYALFCKTPYGIDNNDPMLVKIYLSENRAKESIEKRNSADNIGQTWWIETVELNTEKLEEIVT